MMVRSMRAIVALVLVVVARTHAQAQHTALEQWATQNSQEVSESGAVVSTVGYDTSLWCHYDGEATAMAALVQCGRYKDPLEGLRLLAVDPAQFQQPWWFRAEFSLNVSDSFSAASAAPALPALLHLDGINYRGELWVNGQRVLDSSELVGTFRYFDVVISEYLLSANETQCIALKLWAPDDQWHPSTNESTDLAISFLDWAPQPPDYNMGVWRDIAVHTSASSKEMLLLRYPLVDTTVSRDLAAANLTVALHLWSSVSEATTVTVTVNSTAFASLSQTVKVPAGVSAQDVVFSFAEYPALQLRNPRLWWPFQMGEPFLHFLSASAATAAGAESEELTARVGLREITSQLDANQHRLYSVNHRRILIRGAGWAPDLFLRTEVNRTRAQMAYVRDMGLNTVRFEGKLEDDIVFDSMDELGLLAMPGWCCCDAWQHWSAWEGEQFKVAKESMVSQGRRLRSHASMLVFVYSSDDMPPPDVEHMYLDALQSIMWPNPTLASASQLHSPITGDTGVKMSGPYVWEPPVYWLQDTSQLGGAFGFLTEGGPGASPMVLESVEATMPADALWPINFFWDFHCGSQHGLFGDLSLFTPPLQARYGNSTAACDYLYSSQLMTYEAQRAMFEAYSRNKYTSTGLIQWMLNNAFPEMYWNLFDYYLNQGGSYFGAKKAARPLHVMYSYTDASLWVINSQYVPGRPVTAIATLFDIDGRLLLNITLPVGEVAEDSSVQIGALPQLPSNVTTTYFLQLQLVDQASSDLVVDSHVYWLSTVADVLDWDASNFYLTPCSSYADLTALAELPPPNISVSYVVVPPRTERSIDTSEQALLAAYTFELPVTLRVTVTNTGSVPALAVRTRLVDAATGLDVLPVFWSDNFVTLFAGQSATLTVSYDDAVTGSVSVLAQSYATRCA